MLLVGVACSPTSVAGKNIALSKHQIHHHLSWFNTKDKHAKAHDSHLGPHSSAWSFWKQAFENVANGREQIKFQQINQLFQEHYNLHHAVYIEDTEQEQFELANSNHFTEEAIQFKQWLGSDHDNAFSYEKLHDLMTKFMDERHEERKGLMEYAKHIYKAEL